MLSSMLRCLYSGTQPTKQSLVLGIFLAFRDFSQRQRERKDVECLTGCNRQPRLYIPLNHTNLTLNR